MTNKFSDAWKMMPTDWLLDGAPFVKYRILADLLNRPENDQEVTSTKESISKYDPLRRILERQDPNGYDLPPFNGPIITSQFRSYLSIGFHILQ